MPNSVSCNGEIRLSLHLWFETAPPRPIHPDCHTGLPLAPAPLDGFHQDYSSCSMALYMSRVYHPHRMVSTGMEKVLRIDRPDGRRVHREKVDGPPGRRGAADAAGCVEGLWKKVLKIDWPFRARGFLGLTAFQAEGCGIALSGDEYKVSVTGLAFCVIWHDTHSGD